MKKVVRCRKLVKPENGKRNIPSWFGVPVRPFRGFLKSRLLLDEFDMFLKFTPQIGTVEDEPPASRFRVRLSEIFEISASRFSNLRQVQCKTESRSIVHRHNAMINLLYC